MKILAARIGDAPVFMASPSLSQTKIRSPDMNILMNSLVSGISIAVENFKVKKSLVLSVILIPIFVGSASLAEDSASSRAAGKPLNPDIGANFLGLARHGVHSPAANGLLLQEVELQLTADVDTYFRAVTLLAIEQEPAGEFGIDPEEVYAETTSLPLVTFRGGKFLAAFGRHNSLHAHAFPFIDAPLINQAVLGEGGLNDAGLSGSLLLPVSWFSELTVQGLGGRNDVLFNNPNRDQIAGVAQFKNLFDLSDDLTLENSVFGTTGKNTIDDKSHGFGSDLTLKWRPSEGGKYRSLAFTTEYLQGVFGGNADQPHLGGLASWLQFQFAQRWWAQGRVEWLGLPRGELTEITKKQSLLLGFFPSEFSGLRLQYDHITQVGAPTDNVVAFQWNISIGAHPAHTY